MPALKTHIAADKASIQSEKDPKLPDLPPVEGESKSRPTTAEKKPATPPDRKSVQAPTKPDDEDEFNALSKRFEALKKR